MQPHRRSQCLFTRLARLRHTSREGSSPRGASRMMRAADRRFKTLESSPPARTGVFERGFEPAMIHGLDQAVRFGLMIGNLPTAPPVAAFSGEDERSIIERTRQLVRGDRKSLHWNGPRRGGGVTGVVSHSK